MIGVGCGQKSVDVPSSVQAGSNNEEIQAEQTHKIEVFFADPQIEKLVKGEEEISFTNSTEKYQRVFEALQQDTHAELIPLWSKVEMISSTFKEGTLTLNIHIPDEARMGTSGELLALEALKSTFFQFDEIQSIDILVDGKALDSLMGHVDLEHPLGRDNK